MSSQTSPVAQRCTADLKLLVRENRCEAVFHGHRIYFEVEGFDLSDVHLSTAALWACLPLAMQTATDIRLTSPVDELAFRNARSLVAHWCSWVPERYSFINILPTAGNVRNPPAERGRLFFFSGGFDSHSMLLRQQRLTSKDKVVTICGLDYRPQTDRFQLLLQKTAPTLDYLGLERIVVTTNIGEVIRNLKLNHGFILASIGFLFSNRFKSFHLASDARRLDEFLLFPWGTNSISNALFASEGARLVTEDLDEGRSDKVLRLNQFPDLLPNVSFCSDSKVRPENCGRCAKCIRTKARFHTLVGHVPPIFEDNRFDDGHIARLDFNNRVIFQSMMATFIDSGPDYTNSTVRLIKRKLDAATKSRKSFWRRWMR